METLLRTADIYYGLMFYGFYDLFHFGLVNFVGHEFRSTVRDSWNVVYDPQHDYV